MEEIKYIAHSYLKDEYKEIPEQSYENHVYGVYNGCLRELNRIEKFIKLTEYFKILKKSVLIASIYHDLGKLDNQFQSIIHRHSEGKMINHVDAGVSYLLAQYKDKNDTCFLIAAYFVLSHHIGLPNYDKVFSNPSVNFRDKKSLEKYCMGSGTVKEHVDKNMEQYLKIHRELVHIEESFENTSNRYCKGFLSNPIMLKLGIGLLVSADHEDTAVNYKDISPVKMKKINFSKNLSVLENNVALMKKSFENGEIKCSKDRFDIRNDVFDSCGNINIEKDFFLVDGTVGVGKTLSIMRAALKLAKEKSLDTITFILPYIALIDQSASEYIKYLFDDFSESKYALEVIHSVFKTKNLFHRKYSKGFNAPINLTTSVNFFNVISSNSTSIFKNIIKFVGNVVVIDEYPAIASYEFWSVILNILKDMAEHFSCKFIFSSGTPVYFWDLLKDVNIDVEKIIGEDLYNKMIALENNRVTIIDECNQEWDFEKLSNEILNKSQSCFVIVNTRKKAVKLADILMKKTTRKVFLRFSGLDPINRNVQFEKIKKHMDKDVIVVATQGSDIGLDLSFHHGFKEVSSYDSAAQMKGRINRGCEFTDSTMTIFKLCKCPNNDGIAYKDNPSFNAKRKILESIETYRKILSPSDSTHVAQLEMREMGPDLKREMEHLQLLWSSRKFEDLGEEFNLISSPCIHLMVNSEIIEKIKKNQYVPYNEIQANIVNIFFNERVIEDLKGLIELADKDLEDDKQNNTSGLYFWYGCYDPENFGIFDDPVFGLREQKNLII